MTEPADLVFAIAVADQYAPAHEEFTATLDGESLVRLESGRLGVVMEQHGSSLLTPRVKVFFSAKSKMPIQQQIIDLAKLVGREKIIGRESQADWNFPNLEELWSELPVRKGSYFD